ncbi:MAG: LemA family protein [Desulfitobacterium sp.]
MKKWLIPVGIILILAMILGSGYNNLVTLNETVDNSWSQVENQLQRRADLIPNLVNTVKGYAEHESEVFTDIADARSRLIGAGSVGEAAEADAELSSALSRLLAISESYPQLKADANFRGLQDELAGTENRIATTRMDYNNVVQTYNTKIKRLPTALYAGILGFDEREYFKADASAQETPTVDFSK